MRDQPWATVRLSIDIPGAVPDGTYVVWWPVAEGESLIRTIRAAAHRQIDTLIDEQLDVLLGHA